MPEENFQDLCGYVYKEEAIQKFIDDGRGSVMSADKPLVSGKGLEGFLFDVELSITGNVRGPHYQKIGSCVSHGVGGAAEDLQFVQMCSDPTLVYEDICTEVIYGLARVQIGKGGCGFQDGAVVAWAFEAIQEFGLLARGKYGEYDLTENDESLAKQFGDPRRGAPKELAEASRSHLVIGCHLITPSRNGPSMYEQARDVIANRGLVVTGSNQLFSSDRDKQGFCRPEGHGGHCTYYRGYTDNSKRPGICYKQSWGPSVPRQGRQEVELPSGRVVALPPGDFLIDAEAFDRMHSGGGSEVWALTAQVGWVPPDDEINFSFYLPNGQTLNFLSPA